MPNFPPLPEHPRPWPEKAPLEAGLEELSEWWLDVACGCRGKQYVPLRLLAGHQGWTLPLKALAARLRCPECGQRPHRITLVDNPAGGAIGSGYGPQRRLEVAALGW